MDKVVKNFSEYSEFNKSIDLLNNIRDIFLDIEDDEYKCEYLFHKFKGDLFSKIGEIKAFNLNGEEVINRILPSNSETDKKLLNNRWFVRITGNVKNSNSNLMIDRISKCVERTKNAYDLNIIGNLSYYNSENSNSRMFDLIQSEKKTFYFENELNKRYKPYKNGDIDYLSRFHSQINFIN